MRWLKVLVVVISSAWFFPVSCTAGLYAGIGLTSLADSRDASKGEPVHSKFSIVSETHNGGEPFVVTRLDTLRRYEESLPPGSTFSASYLMSKPSGRTSDDFADYSYRVLDEKDSEQIIEVVESYHDGDNTIWSRYKATPSEVIPISSRMFYFGYVFSAFPYALAFSILVYGVGWYLKRRMLPSRPGKVDT